MKQLIIVLVVLTSCNTSKKIINTKDISISLTKIQCGSYEVKNNESVIGYAVKPFIIEVDRMKEITRFENLSKSNYKNRYEKFYRIYLFTKNSIGDTALNVIMIKPKHASLIPDWQCEEQELDTYWRKRHATSPLILNYNCTKGRFKILGDPD